MGEIAGIVGGLGPESTIDYYRTLVERWRARAPGRGYPRAIIDSVDLDVAVALVTAGRLNELAEYLAASLRRLSAAGATFGLVAANTPHIVFGALRDASPIPLLSIVEVACAAARARGLRRPALLGTRFTMQASFYPDVFQAAGIELAIPDPAEQEALHAIYMDELVHGVIREESKERVLAIVDRLAADERIDGVLLAGTELPLLLRADTARGLPVLDTTRLHVDAAIERLIPDRQS